MRFSCTTLCRGLARKVFVLAGLAVLSVSSFAGSYRVTYDASACRTTVIGPSGEQWYASYWEQDGGVRGGESSRDPDGPGPLPNTNLGPGSVSASGTIKVTFTWAPSYVGDLPPGHAIVEEVGSAGWVGTSGSCSDGIGGTPTGSTYEGSSSNTRYWIKTDPGESFTFNVNPAASANRTPEFIQGLVYQANAELSYRAGAAPLRLWLIGTTRANNIDNAEIGQRIGGEPTVEDRTFAPSFDFRNQMSWENPEWGVAGNYFKKFVTYYDASYGYRVNHEPADYNDRNMRWCWTAGNSVNQTMLVSCATNIYVFGHSLGRVTLKTQAKVLEPTMQSLTTTTWGVSYTLRSVIAADTESGLPGIIFNSNVQTNPTIANAQGNGQYMFAQLIAMDRHRWLPAPLGHHWIEFDEKQLDGSWGYAPTPPGTFVADGQAQSTNDSPEWGITGSVAYKVFDKFDMYLMYCPPGGDWVPLQRVSWTWKASGTRETPWSHWPNPINGSVASEEAARDTVHPRWNARFVGSSGGNEEEDEG